MVGAGACAPVLAAVRAGHGVVPAMPAVGGVHRGDRLRGHGASLQVDGYALRMSGTRQPVQDFTATNGHIDTMHCSKFQLPCVGRTFMVNNEGKTPSSLKQWFTWPKAVR